MRNIQAKQITEVVKRLCIKANIDLNPPVEEAIRKARETEASPVGREILDQLLENAALAREQNLPICQVHIQKSRGVFPYRTKPAAAGCSPEIPVTQRTSFP